MPNRTPATARPPRKRFHPAGAVLGLVALLAVLAVATLRPVDAETVAAEDGPEPAAARRDDGAASALPRAARVTRSVVVPANEPELRRAPDLDDDGLREALRRLATIDMFDGEFLEARLAPFATNPGNLDRVVELLARQALGSGTDPLALEEVGAVRAIVCTVAVLHPIDGASSALEHSGVSRDGRVFFEAVLTALAPMRPPVRAVLAEMLAAIRDANGRLVLDLSYEGVLTELAFVHPELSDLYLGMLADVATDFAPETTRALDTLHVLEGESPRLVTASLSRLLDGSSAEQAMRWAVELYDLPATTPEMRRAVATAVAVAGPVDSAAEFLAERASTDLYAEFATLGDRRGGVRALRDRYVLHRVNGTGDEARRMLVSGMVDEQAERLIALALDDPSATVRGQAWTTLTLGDDFTPSEAVLGFLREGFVNRADADIGIPAYALLGALSNFARRSAPGARGRDAALHTELLAFVREVALEPDLSAHERARAMRILEQHLSADAFAAFRQAATH